ncbi:MULTISPECIES: LppU/SCO3897 family protein [unclassified Streptomyces]|uniref:LppU/SCO3897 family protein n=1 Tax=Streptomyces sp. NPDC127129 TaxID=3345373 RepID=UPI003632855A
MSSPELPITLTPQQAATGVTLTLTLPTGPAHIRIPPCRHGDLIPAQVGAGTVLLRIQVAGPAQAPRKASPWGCLVTLGVIGAVIAALVLTNDGDDETPTAGSPPAATTATPSPFPTTDPVPTATTEAPPDPYTKGTCLNGTLPDSTTAQSVSDIDEVDCSASDAHYRVIQTFPLTSDLNRCNANPKTQYAFSHRYTINGATVNEYVYCLVGLGTYAR